MNTVDREMLALMKKAGCYLICYGLESGSQEVLDKLGKGTTVEQGIRAVEMAHEAGIKVFGSFMVGSPGETAETVEATIRLIRKMKLDEIGLGVTTAYPGTDLFDTFGRDVQGLDWDKALAFNPSAADHSEVFLKCTDLEDAEIRRLFHRAMRERCCTIRGFPRLSQSGCPAPRVGAPPQPFAEGGSAPVLDIGLSIRPRTPARATTLRLGGSSDRRPSPLLVRRANEELHVRHDLLHGRHVHLARAEARRALLYLDLVPVGLAGRAEVDLARRPCPGRCRRPRCSRRRTARRRDSA